MISCGEASGDLYAGALVRSMRAMNPHVRVFGFGGGQMEAAGAELVGDYRGLSVTGLVEAVRKIPPSLRMLRKLRHEAAARRPAVFVAIDFPDFNFRLLRAMRDLGIPIVYYVSPQLWAWRSGRIQTIKQFVDRMLVIFPFETAIYEKAHVPVEFVGHPLVDLAVARHDRRAILARAKLRDDQPVIALLPGSRANELREILPTLVDAAVLMSRQRPGLQFLIARAPALADRGFAPLEKLGSAGIPHAVIEGETDDVLAAADVVVTASGTATVQTALHGRPMIVVYRLSPVTFAIGRPFVRVHTYAMVNLVAGRPIVPELIQERFTPEATARETMALLTDPARAQEMRAALEDVRRRLGRPGASDRAAAAVLGLTMV
ncbi:MAG TPA: lipid-A-disaccharide synthase [Vicinamibacterales bacterium]|nr:lipid-A-disaccharide synthase [Vicinamibacterales bacterium]